MNDFDAKKRRYERFNQWAEIPMLVLSVLTIPVVVMPFLEDLSSQSTQALWILGIGIWILFIIEYAVMIYLAPNRREAVLSNKLNLALVLIPLLRPLQVARLARVAHAGTAIARAAIAVGRLFGRPGFTTVVATVAGLIVGGGGLVTIAEHDQSGSTIADFGDGLWWAFVTCTTVGYGDTVPVTGTGRAIAVVLMLAGISGLSMITANIAAFFVADDNEDSEEELESVSARLARIERQLDLILKHNSDM